MIWTIYLCHACGWIQGEEEENLACARCGESRSMIEKVEVERCDPFLGSDEFVVIHPPNERS